MLKHAARRAEANGFRHVTYREMDAERLEFGADLFDAVTCCCGLMFFPDPVGALKEMHRVLKPGGRLVIVVWGEPARNPFVTVGGQAVAEFFPSAATADPSAPNAFRFAKADSLQTMIGEAGFRDIHVEQRPLSIEFASADEYFGVFTQMAAGARQKVLQMPGADLARLRASVNASARAHEVDGRLKLTATPQCASARK
jgi:ubiquinone/menaquinone biosynthesis C-methylase UbiE